MLKPNGSIPTYMENVDEDFFAFVLEDSACIAILVTSWVFVTFFAAPLLAGLVAFKNFGTLNYQTLIDKLNAYFYFLLLTFSLSGHNILMLRLFWKIPKFICILKIVQWGSNVAALSITATEVHILRFLYICVWKNVGALTDDLFGNFFFVFNSVISVGQGCLIFVTQDYLGMELAFCEGVDPRKYSETHESWNITLIFSFLCCLTVLIIMLLVAVTAKRQNKDSVQAQNASSTTSTVYDMQKLLEATIILAVLMALGLEIYVMHMYSSGKIREVTPWVLALSQTFLHFIVIFLLPLSVYSSHERLRKHVVKVVMDTDLAQTMHSLIQRWKGQVGPS